MEAAPPAALSAGRGPPLLYGTAWKAARTAELVGQALAAGFRGIDTACQPKHYNEAGVGAGVATAVAGGLARSELYLQTKFTPLDGHDPKRIPYDPQAPLDAQVAQSFAVSLSNLGTDYVDCLVLHSPLPTLPELMTVWTAMEQLAAAGRARQLGISNCYSEELLATLVRSAQLPPRVVQNRFYAATGYDRGIRAYCRAHEIRYQSFWTLSANAALLGHAELGRLAARYAVTPAQVLLRYLTQVGVVPLTGTTSARHLRQALAIFEFELAPAEVASLVQLT